MGHTAVKCTWRFLFMPISSMSEMSVMSGTPSSAIVPPHPRPPHVKQTILVLVGGKYWRHPLLCHGPSPFSAPSCKAKTTLMRYISRQTFAHPTYKTKTTLMRIFRGKHLHISPNSLCIPPIKQRRHLCDIPVFRGKHLLFPPPRSWNEHGQDTSTLFLVHHLKQRRPQ